MVLVFWYGFVNEDKSVFAGSGSYHGGYDCSARLKVETDKIGVG